MRFDHIFDVFSRRGKQSRQVTRSLPPETRYRVLTLCKDIFDNKELGIGSESYSAQLWEEVHHSFQYLHGRPILDESVRSQTRSEDVFSFLLKCNDDEFLDFVEYLFKVECLHRVRTEPNEIVKRINRLFELEGIGYVLTLMETEVVSLEGGCYPPGMQGRVIRVKTYPQIIRKDDQLSYAQIVKPVLSLLNDSLYRSANEEILEALEDYRRGDYDDCLTKCGSAFESVMKIICDKKGWKYRQEDTASILLSIIIKESKMEPFFEAPLIVIATLRNKLSKSHGAGTQKKTVAEHHARFAINATGTAILFLTDVAK